MGLKEKVSLIHQIECFWKFKRFNLSFYKVMTKFII